MGPLQMTIHSLVRTREEMFITTDFAIHSLLNSNLEPEECLSMMSEIQHGKKLTTVRFRAATSAGRFMKVIQQTLPPLIRYLSMNTVLPIRWVAQSLAEHFSTRQIQTILCL